MIKEYKLIKSVNLSEIDVGMKNITFKCGEQKTFEYNNSGGGLTQRVDEPKLWYVRVTSSDGKRVDDMQIEAIYVELVIQRELLLIFNENNVTLVNLKNMTEHKIKSSFRELVRVDVFDKAVGIIKSSSVITIKI